MEKQKAETNKNANAALAYLVGWLSGLFFLLTSEDEFIRFNAAQSVIIFGGLTLISLIPFIQVLTIILGPIALVLWVFLMIKAYNNKKYEVPFIGSVVSKLENAIKPQN